MYSSGLTVRSVILHPPAIAKAAKNTIRNIGFNRLRTRRRGTPRIVRNASLPGKGRFRPVIRPRQSAATNDLHLCGLLSFVNPRDVRFGRTIRKVRTFGAGAAHELVGRGGVHSLRADD